MFLIFRLQRPYSLLELTHDPLPERYPISSFRLDILNHEVMEDMVNQVSLTFWTGKVSRTG